MVSSNWRGGSRKKLAPEIERRIYVATAEDTILAKLRWSRAGGEISSTQWSDVLGIIGTQGKLLDVEFLRECADRLGARELLERALRETK